ncbi:MAG: hypothetical protein M2R45_03812 [Verrucomicrobia subdivision 3 bacterium]|nr:hypothetical protein [Limisphaerales bacterium]MCS1415768.1 hypothetical protein [Limisphaerales bacterium]
MHKLRKHQATTLGLEMAMARDMRANGKRYLRMQLLSVPDI